MTTDKEIKRKIRICHARIRKRVSEPIIPETDSFFAEYCREFSGSGAEE